MPTDHTERLLPDVAALDEAQLEWVAMLAGRVPPGSDPIRLDEPRHDEKGYTLLAWHGNELLAVARAVEVFKGGEWRFITWILEGDRRHGR